MFSSVAIKLRHCKSVSINDFGKPTSKNTRQFFGSVKKQEDLQNFFSNVPLKFCSFLALQNIFVAFSHWKGGPLTTKLITHPQTLLKKLNLSPVATHCVIIINLKFVTFCVKVTSPELLLKLFQVVITLFSELLYSKQRQYTAQQYSGQCTKRNIYSHILSFLIVCMMEEVHFKSAITVNYLLIWPPVR